MSIPVEVIRAELRKLRDLPATEAFLGLGDLDRRLEQIARIHAREPDGWLWNRDGESQYMPGHDAGKGVSGFVPVYLDPP